MAAKKVLITGAAGGMGRACARLLGMTHDLILADVSAERLNAFADELEADRGARTRRKSHGRVTATSNM